MGEEVKETKFFYLIADKVESHHSEQLPICLQFVDKECNIREEFVQFGKCEQTNDEFVLKDIRRIIEKTILTLNFVVVKGTMEHLICLLRSQSESGGSFSM